MPDPTAPTPTPIITQAWLVARYACEDEVAIFAREWPDGVEVSPEALARAVELRLDLDWLARRALSATAGKAYREAVAPARKAYREAVAPARKAYSEAVATAGKAYKEAVAPAYKAYDEAVATAGKAFDEAVATAGKAYDEAVATAGKAYDEAVATALWDCGTRLGWAGVTR